LHFGRYRGVTAGCRVTRVTPREQSFAKPVVFFGGMTMTDDILTRLAELRSEADRLETLLSNGRRPPGLLVARAGVAVDQAADRLAKVADKLSAGEDGKPGRGGKKR